MEYQGKRPEAFSDADSKADRTRRTIKAISVSFFIFIALEILYAVMLTIYRNKLSPSDKTQLIIAEAFFCLLTLALGVVALIVRKNEKR
jgi:hypothetical protein